MSLKRLFLLSWMAILLSSSLAEDDFDPYLEDADEMLDAEYVAPTESYDGIQCTGVSDDLSPSQMNRVDKLIQRFQGTVVSRVAVRWIKRQLKNKRSYLYKILGLVGKDPRDKDFPTDAVSTQSAIPGSLVQFLVKVVGGTRTVVGYLWTFGFLPKVLNRAPEDNYEGDIPPCAVTNAIRAFQRFNGLEPSGRLTKATRDLMAKDRCGNADVECKSCEPASRRDKRYVLRNKIWVVPESKHLILKYYFKNYATSRTMTQEQTKSEIEQGFKAWTNKAPIFFVETTDESEADIQISFSTGYHDDKYDFDGPGGVIGHAFYPDSGQIHFDDEESFVMYPGPASDGDDDIPNISIFFTSTHEVGHTLGVKHTSIKGSIMYPYYDKDEGIKETYSLKPDDVSAITALYGPGTGGVYPIGTMALFEQDTFVKPPCDVRFGATFTDPISEKLERFILFGARYLKLATKGDDPSYSTWKLPRVRERTHFLVKQSWREVYTSGPFHAAVTFGTNTYFFKDDQVCVYNWNAVEAPLMSCTDTSDHITFQGIPGRIDAAVAHNKYNMLVFSGNKYYIVRTSGVKDTSGHISPFQDVYLAFNSFYSGYFYISRRSDPGVYYLLKTKTLYNKGVGCGTAGCAEAAILSGWSKRDMFNDWKIDETDFNFCDELV